MVSPRKDIMAQAVYLAQLEAAKAKCKCATCRILRKVSGVMTEQFLAGDPAAATAAPPGGAHPLAEFVDPAGAGGEEV